MRKGGRACCAARLLIRILEDPAETSYIRGRAAEALTYGRRPGAAEACARSLSDPDPRVRFWAVFALGSIARFRRGLHAFAAARLEPLTGDEGEMPGYWSVGLEARAMLEDIYPERREAGEKGRQAILADANAPKALRRWAECYSWTSPPPGPRYLQVQARYGKFTWRGERKEKRARGRRGAETP